MADIDPKAVPLRPGSIKKYSADAECPRIAIPLTSGGHRYYDQQLHDWRCISTPDGALWYCTRCQKISTKQPRRPRKRKAAEKP